MSLPVDKLNCSATAQKRRLSLIGHIAQMPAERDAKILTASLLGELDETTRTSSYYVDEDYPAGPEIQ